MLLGVLVTCTGSSHTLSKFFKRSIILPSTSCSDKPAGAEYHREVWTFVKGAVGEGFLARHGATALDMGSRVRTPSLDAHRTD